MGDSTDRMNQQRQNPTRTRSLSFCHSINHFSPCLNFKTPKPHSNSSTPTAQHFPKMASILPTIPTLLSHSLPSPAHAHCKPSQPVRKSRPFPNFPNFPRNPSSFFNCPNKFASNPPALTNSGFRVHLSANAVSGYTEEPETKAKFQTSLSLPGCSSPLSLIGTGYREKVFAIIGVKVYAAGLYSNPSVFSKLDAWKGRSSAELEKDSTFFNAIFQAPLEKSLQIILVRDLDGKTFWNALDEAISPRITSPTSVDGSAISTFRGVFQGRPLIKGTFIFLTWLDTEKMMVSVSEGFPSSVDATIESSNVTSALFDVFLGDNPVSPSLKASVSKGLAAALN